MPRTPDVSDQEFRDAVEAWMPNGGKLPSTSDIKRQINSEHGTDYDRKTIYRRLSDLESQGAIRKVEVGEGRGRSIGWIPLDCDLNKITQSSPSGEKLPGQASQVVTVVEGLVTGALLLVGFFVAAELGGGSVVGASLFPWWVEGWLLAWFAVLAAHGIGLIDLDRIGQRLVNWASPITRQVGRVIAR